MEPKSAPVGGDFCVTIAVNQVSDNFFKKEKPLKIAKKTKKGYQNLQNSKLKGLSD